MRRRERLYLEEKMYPVQAYFNAITDSVFLRVIEDFSKGIGSGFESVVCCFPGDLDLDEDPITGIQFIFSLGDEEEEVILSYSEFQDILRQVAEGYLEDNPADRERVEYFLDKIDQLLANPDPEQFKPGGNVIPG